MKEGQFKNGMLDGFGRHFKLDLKHGFVKIGYFKPKEGDSVMEYLDGKGYYLRFSAKDTEAPFTQPWEITNDYHGLFKDTAVQSKPITSFIENELFVPSA